MTERKSIILVCDDEPAFLDLYEEILEPQGVTVLKSRTGREAIRLAEEEMPDLILLDVSLPGLSGYDVCSLLKKNPRTQFIPLIMVTAHFKEVQDRVHGMERGADDYITKPFHHQELIARVKAIRRLRELNDQLHREERSRQELQKTIVDLETRLKGGVADRPIIGKNLKIERILELLDTIKDTAANVLILGESGTGKGLMAEAVHRSSVRRDKPFVKVDCAAIPASLMESGLFGHEKGSFTGAVKTHIGPFERADGGTIFLDEIGEIPLELQAKLLRVVQEMNFERVGGEKTIQVDVRIIAATNVLLEKAVEEKRFRLDLFYRLNVIRIDLPPLRERPEDIIPLAEYFLRQFCAKNQKELRGFDEGAVRRLLGHGWPGNVRELENVIERAVVLTSGSTISENVIHVSSSQTPVVHENLNQPLRDIVAQVETRAILAALEKCQGSVEKAAVMLGLNRTTLYSKLKKYRINP